MSVMRNGTFATDGLKDRPWMKNGATTRSWGTSNIEVTSKSAKLDISSIQGQIKPTVVTSTAARRRKKEKPILHAIFQSCAALTNDPFWKTLFNESSYGKFPRRFSYHEGELAYKKGVKNPKILIPSEPMEAITICRNFYRQTAGLISDLDSERENRELLSYQVIDPLEGEFKSLKKKIRELVITDYIIAMTKKLGLTLKQQYQLTETINVGFMTGKLKKESVIYSDRAIQGITGLLYDPSTKVFSLDPSLMVSIKSAKSGNNKMVDSDDIKGSIDFEAIWERYVKNLAKQYNQRDKSTRRMATESLTDHTVDETGADDAQYV